MPNDGLECFILLPGKILGRSIWLANDTPGGLFSYGYFAFANILAISAMLFSRRTPFLTFEIRRVSSSCCYSKWLFYLLSPCLARNSPSTSFEHTSYCFPKKFCSAFENLSLSNSYFFFWAALNRCIWSFTTFFLLSDTIFRLLFLPFKTGCCKFTPNCSP